MSPQMVSLHWVLYVTCMLLTSAFSPDGSKLQAGMSSLPGVSAIRPDKHLELRSQMGYLTQESLTVPPMLKAPHLPGTGKSYVQSVFTGAPSSEGCVR